jgi:hypothetical protein
VRGDENTRVGKTTRYCFAMPQFFLPRDQRNTKSSPPRIR